MFSKINIHMNIPFLDKIRAPKNEDDGYFITLVIKQRSVGALLLTKLHGTLELVTSEEVPLLKNVNHLPIEDLIESADRAISKIEASAPPGTFIKKCIFTVPFEWQENGKVNRDRLAELKRLCDDLELIPVGFLVPIEAIMYEMRQQDGALTNMIFLELEDNMMTAYIARAGTIVEIERQSLEGGVGATAEELLKRIRSFDVLPARIIVLRGTQSENLQQELVARDWSQDLAFLHPPQVTVMEEGFENKSIIHGVAEQMKLNVAQGGAPKVATDDIATHATAEEFGFTKEGEGNVEKDADSNVVPIVSDNIVINETTPKIEEAEQFVQQGATEQAKSKGIMDRLKSPFANTQGIPIGFKLAPVAIIILLVGAVYAYYALLLKADVVLYGKEQTSEDDVAVVLSSSEETSDDTLQISTTDIELSGSSSKDATGEETTGEKASGEVTVFNKTEKEVTFSKGEKLKSDSGKEFVISDDIQIASTSAFSTSFSNKKVKVQAADFGSEYNVEKNTNFTFVNFPQANYFAKNSDNFTGGSKKEVVVVSKEDIASVEKDLLAKLQKEAVKKAESDISSKETLIPQVISSELTKKKFDHDAGDEAKKVTLSAVGVFKVGHYADSEASNFIKGVSTDAPEGYVMSEEESKVEFEEIEVAKNGKVTAQAKVVAVHLPKIDEKELGNTLARKTATEAKEIIEQNSTTEDFKIIYSRKLPFMPELLPWNPANIHIALETN